MKIDYQDSTTVTWLILGAIIIIAVLYSVIAIKNQPPVRSFDTDEAYVFPYVLDKTNWRVELPNELKEISGIEVLSENQVLAIQDEAGTLYRVDVRQGTIIDRQDFEKDRDYEDLCLVDDVVYILERDGDLYSTLLYVEGDTAKKYETAFTYRNDTESMCYDRKRNAILIAPKQGSPQGDTLDNNVQGVYSFDLRTKELSLDPVFTVAEREIGNIIGNGGKPHNFKPSALAIHPRSGNLYILASVGKTLIVLGEDNRILHVELLDPELFPQPEGLAFSDEGHLLISSEGVLGAASISRFSPL